MPRNKLKKYQCIRCGYETENKYNIKRHLYNNQKLCSTTLNDIELTDEIKEHIVNYRIYIIPKKKENVNINMLNAFINNKSFDFKLNHLLEYQNQHLMGFDDNLERFFSKRIKRLEDRSYKAPYVLKEDDVIQLVDDVTKIDSHRLDELNVLFDKKIKRFKIYVDGEWESYLEDSGVKELISLIKSYYLDSYELYLLTNLYGENSKVMNKQSLKEHLEIYYKFLAIFDLPIYVFGMSDRDILGHRMVDGNDYRLEELCTNAYNRQKLNLKKSENNRVRKKVIDIVKNNTAHNMAELNTMLLDLLQVDDVFKAKLNLQ